jgi:two-component system, chemotaxis family, chemotaxis protein CheY
MGFKSLIILVVDDNPHMRAIIVAILRGIGVRHIREAPDGASALEQVCEAVPDIIITDFSMQPLNGMELTRLIRTAPDSSHPHVPIIMMTGHADRVTVAAARDAGVNEILVKPVSAKTVIQRLIAVIDQPRSFVQAPRYTGPDRRRRDDPAYRGPERRDQSEFWAV